MLGFSFEFLSFNSQNVCSSFNKMARRNRTASFKELIKRKDFNLQDYGKSSHKNNFSVISGAGDLKFYNFWQQKYSCFPNCWDDVKTSLEKKNWR